MRHVLVATAVALCLSASAALAQPNAAQANVTVRELNKGPAPGDSFAYDPALLRIPVGGTVRFEPTTPGHNVVPIPALWPEGVPAPSVPFSQPATVTFDRAGVYGVQCTPHAGLGMVALIVVGEADLASVAPRIASIPGLAPRARAKLAALASGGA
jgi:pseudoazurin